MLSWIKTRLQAFRDDTRGDMAVEAIIMMPVLLWSYFAIYAFFDAYRTKSEIQKAAFTIGDMLSRETGAITPTYIENTHKLFDFLTNSGDLDTAIRISAIKYDADDEEYEVRWSEVSGAVPSLSNDVMSNYQAYLPNMVDNETVIVVETWKEFKPGLRVGLPDQTLATYSFTRPRFAPQIVWSDT